MSRVGLYRHGFEKKKILKKVPKKIGNKRNADGGTGGAGMRPWYSCHPTGSEWGGHLPQGPSPLDLCDSTAQLLQYCKAGLMFRSCPNSALKMALGRSHIYTLGHNFHPLAHSKQRNCQAVFSRLLAYFCLV